MLYDIQRIGRQRTPTWLLALRHLAGTVTQEAHHMIGSLHLLITGANAPPDKQGVGGLQHKHIVGVQTGSRRLGLREHMRTGEKSEMSAQCLLRMRQQHKSMYWQTAHLHSPG